MKFIVYYRVSTNTQDFESQKVSVEDWLEKNKIKPYKIFKEKISGSSKKRPEYDRIMQLAHKGKIDGVIVYKLDRFGRSAGRLIRDILSLEDFGVKFIAVDTPYLNTLEPLPFKQTILSIFSEVAEIERDITRSRVQAGVDAARARGTRLGRPTKITKEHCAKILEQKKNGRSCNQIAKAIGCHASTVSRFFKKECSVNPVE